MRNPQKMKNALYDEKTKIMSSRAPLRSKKVFVVEIEERSERDEVICDYIVVAGSCRFYYTVYPERRYQRLVNST